MASRSLKQPKHFQIQTELFFATNDMGAGKKNAIFV
jgi:hypothetical protein